MPVFLDSLSSMLYRTVLCLYCPVCHVHLLAINYISLYKMLQSVVLLKCAVRIYDYCTNSLVDTDMKHSLAKCVVWIKYISGHLWCYLW